MVLKQMASKQTGLTAQGSCAQNQATTPQTCTRKTSRYHHLTRNCYWYPQNTLFLALLSTAPQAGYNTQGATKSLTLWLVRSYFLFKNCLIFPSGSLLKARGNSCLEEGNPQHIGKRQQSRASCLGRFSERNLSLARQTCQRSTRESGPFTSLT